MCVNTASDSPPDSGFDCRDFLTDSCRYGACYTRLTRTNSNNPSLFHIIPTVYKIKIIKSIDLWIQINIAVRTTALRRHYQLLHAAQGRARVGATCRSVFHWWRHVAAETLPPVLLGGFRELILLGLTFYFLHACAMVNICGIFGIPKCTYHLLLRKTAYFIPRYGL